MKQIDMRRIEHSPDMSWKLCGDDYDYKLFSNKKPRELALEIINTVFNEEEIKNKRFLYLPYTYRGKQSLMDNITVYYKEKV